MGRYTEAQQQEFVASLRSAAQQTLAQVMQVSKLARFGDNEESLQALDRFADGYRTEEVVNDRNTNGYIFGLGTLLGDLLLKRYGGRWVIDEGYSIETRNAAGAPATLVPFAPVTARLKGNTAASIHRYFFIGAPRVLGFATPQPGPPDAEAIIKVIRNNAATVVKTFSAQNQGSAFGLTARSIAALDQYLERTVNASTSDATKEKLMNMIGSFLGECIVAKYGAKWVISPDGKPHLELKPAKTLHLLDPFGEVAKRIQNGSEDNLEVYFAQLIPHVMSASE